MFNSYKINVAGYGDQERNRVDKHDVSRQSYSLIHFHKLSWYVDIVRNDPFRTLPNRFASDGSKVRAEYFVSICNLLSYQASLIHSLFMLTFIQLSELGENYN